MTAIALRTIGVLVVHLDYFSTAIFWPEDSYNAKLLRTLTSLLMAVMPFYFGSSAAVEWAEKKT